MDRAVRFGEDVRARFGLDAGARIVVGVSGGLDSTVLLRLLHDAGFAVAAAHVNYGLRGAESDGDEAFVRDLAARLGVPVHAKEAALPADQNRQDAARRVRYGFFQHVAEAEGAAVVAVGHHRDDQVETVLLHLFRGAGPRGLSGMRPARPLGHGSPVRLIRPLLDVPRAEIEALARARGWDWREDASNAAPHYRRNALRLDVLPRLRDLFGADVDARIAAAADRVASVSGDVTQTVFALLATPLADGGTLDLEVLRRAAPAVRLGLYAEAVVRWAPSAPRTEAALARIDALLDAQPGRRVAWPGVAVWRERDALRFRRDGPRARGPWPVAVGEATRTPFGTLTVEPVAPTASDVHRGDPQTEIVAASALREPLVLRPWRDGDRFRPLGMPGTRLVSDLLTDRKVPSSERRRQLVLCAGDAVVWVVGHRLAHGARIRTASEQALRLRWAPAG